MVDQQPYVPPEAIEREEAQLASYAMRTRLSKGRRHPEEEHPYRTLYQRDRDRIIHSAGFRRLMYKTQVLVNHYSDHHRTRLTHTLEVAQISRTVARQLGLNEDLTEAIALAHDLGHPPFGHAGETALNDCMKGHGGFEHNRHGFRLVDQLEHRYPTFPGLNLTHELLESMAYHSKRRDAPELREFLTDQQTFLEAQVVDAADSLAYDTHDLDDALSLGLITLDDCREVEFWRRGEERVRKRYAALTPQELQAGMVRCLIDWQVNDLLDHVRLRLARQRIRTVADVRGCATVLAAPGEELTALKAQLEEFLARRVYRHSQVVRMAAKARRFITELFHEFARAPQLLPRPFVQHVDVRGVEQTVCDYLASMTDRSAQDEYARLFLPHESSLG